MPKKNLLKDKSDGELFDLLDEAKFKKEEVQPLLAELKARGWEEWIPSPQEAT
jgi:hypothetical protein